MRVKLKNLMMCTGDIYEDAEAEVDEEFLNFFMKLEPKDCSPVFVNPEAIASFQMEEIKEKPKLNIIK